MAYAEPAGVETFVEAADPEVDLERQAMRGDRQAFDRLYDCYFARTAWYFRSLRRAEAEASMDEVLSELFGHLEAPSRVALSVRACRLARMQRLRKSQPRG